MTREQVNLVSPCIEIIGQVRYRRGWNLSKILEAKKKKAPCARSGYRFERIRSVRDAVLARSPLVIALTDRQVGRRLTGDRQAEERHCPDSQRKPNLSWGEKEGRISWRLPDSIPQETRTPHGRSTALNSLLNL